jgi:hypothetical protein
MFLFVAVFQWEKRHRQIQHWQLLQEVGIAQLD